MDVLIVDDNAAFAANMVDILALDGIVASAAHTGQQALDILTEGDADLIILDLVMQPMDGPTTLRLIREFKPGQLVMGATAYDFDHPLAIQINEMGVETILPKPIDPQRLVRVVEEYLNT